MRDIEPDNYSVVEKIRGVFVETCGLFGFKVMEPSPIEMLTTLEAKSGAGVRDEIYHFKDKGGREVGLRFDLTVGITRYVASQRGLQLPYKIGAFSDMWRYDEPQHGRYRWFYQWDAEIFGPSNVEVDAEVIEFTSILFEKLGLDTVSIRIGDRKLVEEFIRRRLGVSDEGTLLEMLRALDKIGKKPASDILSEYEGKGVDRKALERLIELGKTRGEPELVLAELEKQKLGGDVVLIELYEALKARQVRNVVFDLGVVRGLDYYTGIVFEVYCEKASNLGALAGGGRFDILPKTFGRPDMNAMGVAGGVDRMVLALAEISPKSVIRADNFVYVGYVNRGLARMASNLASILRREGVPTELELSDRNLRRQLEVASVNRIPFVVIVAPRESSQGKVILKNMMKGTEETIEMGDTATVVKQRMRELG